MDPVDVHPAEGDAVGDSSDKRDVQSGHFAPSTSLGNQPQHKTVPRTLVLPRRLMLMGPFDDTPNQLIHSDSITKIRKRKLVMDSETCCHR